MVDVIALAAWLGAALFFSATVAPGLFAVLPTRALAGAVVGRLLPVVFYTGIAVGALVAALEVSAHRAWSWRGRETAAAVMIAACAIGQLVIGSRIERLRAEIGVPMDALPVTDPRRVEFGRLHGLSVAWLGLAMLAAAVALVLSARARHVDGERLDRYSIGTR
jgi:hypothetical protein